MRVARVLKRRASNCLPWSVVICWGQPIQATQTETKALATASAVMSERGNASGQGVYLPMAVRQYLSKKTPAAALSDQYARERNLPKGS